MQSRAEQLINMADACAGDGNETALVYATAAVAVQLGRIADIMEHAHGTPPWWNLPQTEKVEP